MNKKISLGVCISLIAVACAVTFVLTMSLSLDVYNQRIAGVDQRGVINAKLQNIDSYVRNSFFGAIDEERLVNGIMSGYMAGLGDSKSRYIPDAEFYELQQHTRGRIITAGIQVVRNENGYIRVTGVYEGSSAELQGIEVDDIITSINNMQVLEIGAESAIRMLSGEEGVRLVITIQRDGEERRFTLSRQDVELITVKSAQHGDFGFIKISAFAENTGEQFEAALGEVLANNAKGLIIDLRGTSGSLITPQRQILDRLLPRCTAAVAQLGNGSVNNLIEITSESFVNLPVTIITDGNTAEGGELLAAALKDFAGAQLVGTVTKGDAMFTNTQTLGDGSAVILSIMKVRSGGGTSFDGEGIRPDFLVEMTTPVEMDLYNLENTRDLQIRKAFEVTEARIQGTVNNEQ
ncbi:MAG: S41 family peptidase [Oscillospiraceae bacterium]|nr:S41 family peptidase [Oscillospiraceae bacterium]